MNQEKWLIRGGWPAHGEVSLSGDSYSAIANICHALLHTKQKAISNVPRSQELLSFINFANKCGLKIKWVSTSKITCEVNWDNIQTDLSAIIIESHKHFELIVDMMLAKRGSCKVPLKFRKYLDRYRRLNMQIVVIEDVCYEVNIPLSIVGHKMHIRSIERDFYTILSYSILKYCYKEIYITCKHQNDPVRIFQNPEYSTQNEYKVDMNYYEFNFYLGLLMLTEGEILIHEFELSEVLSILLYMNEIGISYEGGKKSLRVWYEYKKIKQYYSFSKLLPDSLGYILLYLSTNAKNNVLAKVSNTPMVISLIKNLNMIGCQINYELTKNPSLLLEIRPSSIKSFKEQISGVDYGGVILSAGFAYDGNTLISDVDQFSGYIPFLAENLSELDLKFSSR